MRRKWNSTSRRTRVIGPDLDIRQQLEAEQLQNFAASCLTWNRIENSINVALCFCLGLPPKLRLDVASRINGLDDKMDIIYASLKKYLSIEDSSYQVITSTIGAAKEYKRYRDGIIHAYIVDPKEPAAMTTQRQGKMDEVLITKDALDALYKHLVAIYTEMRVVVQIIQLIEPRVRSYKPGDQKGNEAAIRGGIALILEHQKHRRSLPPLPQFPEEEQGPRETEGPPEPKD